MQKKYLSAYNISLKASIVATALWIGIMAVFLTDIINNYQLLVNQEGLMNSMFSVGALIALVANISLQARFKKSAIIVVFGFIAAGSLLLQGIPMSFMFFLGSCLLMGFGSGAADSCQSALLADLNPEDTAKQMGSLHGIFGVGGVLTPIFLSELAKHFHWRQVYVMTGLIACAFILQFAVVSTRMNKKMTVSEHIEPKLSLADFREALKNKSFVFVLMCIFFGGAAQSGIIVWIIRYVSEFLQNPGIAALCLSVFWVATTLSRFSAPLLPFSPAQVVGVGAILAALVWAAAISLGNSVLICIACGIVGLFTGSCIPMTVSVGAAIFPKATGFSTSMLMIFKTIAQTLSPIMVAFAMESTTTRTGMYLTSIFFILNGLFGLLLVEKKTKLKT